MAKYRPASSSYSKAGKSTTQQKAKSRSAVRPRSLPMWGGVSEGGFVPILFHPNKKLDSDEWVEAVENGCLDGAIKKLKPVSNEGLGLCCAMARAFSIALRAAKRTGKSR